MRDQLRLIPHSHLNYDYLDFEVNGVPLLHLIHVDVLYGTKPSEHRLRSFKSNLVSTLRVTPGLSLSRKTTQALRLMLDGADRVPLLGCSACSEECEAVTATIERVNGAVAWTNFRFSPAADVREAFGSTPEPKWATLLQAGPFWFDEAEYRSALDLMTERIRTLNGPRPASHRSRAEIADRGDKASR